MTNVGDLQPDPSVIGNVAKPPFVQLPDPACMPAKRAARLCALAAGQDLESYLRFLADLTAASIPSCRDIDGLQRS